MAANQDYVVDFVAPGDAPDELRLVLVEEGPWADTTRELLRLQNRLYDCIDAVLDGELAAELPETKKARIVIQVDGYNLPKAAVSDFFGRFSQGVFTTGDYQKAVNQFGQSIGFALKLDRPS